MNFGRVSDDATPISSIERNMDISGETVRIRGLNIQNSLIVNTNNYEVDFCIIEKVVIQGDKILLIRNVFTFGQAIVSSQAYILVDNTGIP